MEAYVVANFAQVLCVLQVVDAANLLIQDDERVGTVLLVMAKHGLMEWVPARQNLRPLTIAAGTHDSHQDSDQQCV